MLGRVGVLTSMTSASSASLVRSMGEEERNPSSFRGLMIPRRARSSRASSVVMTLPGSPQGFFHPSWKGPRSRKVRLACACCLRYSRATSSRRSFLTRRTSRVSFSLSPGQRISSPSTSRESHSIGGPTGRLRTGCCGLTSPMLGKVRECLIVTVGANAEGPCIGRRVDASRVQINLTVTFRRKRQMFRRECG